MKITKIEIQNFKAFKQTQLFEIKSKNVLVFGNNGSGKSSFYFALHAFVQSSIKTDVQCAKYFLYDGDESLLNIHAEEGFPHPDPFSRVGNPPRVARRSRRRLL